MILFFLDVNLHTRPYNGVSLWRYVGAVGVGGLMMVGWGWTVGVCGGGGREGRSQIAQGVYGGWQVGVYTGWAPISVGLWVGGCGVVLGNLEQELPRSESINQK